jgi:putative flippase GtrA
VGGPVARFAAVGVASTLAYAVLFLGLRGAAGAALANVVALALTAVANTAANRRFTFRLRGGAGLVRHHLLGAVVFVLTLGLTSGALAVLHGLEPRAPHAVELMVLVAAGAAATVTRYIALRSWVFVRPRFVLHPTPQEK